MLRTTTPMGVRVLCIRRHILKIVEIREQTFPISSPIRNAYIDFSKMTLSLGGGDHRRDPRRQAGGGLRLQLRTAATDRAR